MSLIKVNELLQHATEHHYGVPAINVINTETIRYAIQAAEDEHMPIIIQYWPGFEDHCALDIIAFAARYYAERASVPVAVHQDHSAGYEIAVKGVKAGAKFLGDLAGVSDPETKRKIIGRDFVEVFNEEAVQIKDVRWLAQGTIYPDVIESVSVNGPSATIKSHHNVGGLPEEMHLKIVEPLRLLFKDEVRRVGKSLGIDPQLLGRHPFPGPGLAIRILGDITPEKVEILQNVDKIYIDALREWGLYDQVWQAGAILLPVKSVGVMGDERTYESCVALRAVASTDGMTADWVHLPYDFLAAVSNDIINKVRGVNRVVYDISSKPPATIEWE